MGTQNSLLHIFSLGAFLLFIQYIQVNSPTPPCFSFTCGKGVFAEESLGF